MAQDVNFCVRRVTLKFNRKFCDPSLSNTSVESDMSAAAIPPDETGRLAALHELDLISGPVDAVFDSIVNAVASKLGAPMSALSLVDSDRQWLRPSVGLGELEWSAREHAFCAHSILSDTVFEVEDTLADERFSENPLVVGEPNLRWYAGVPLSVKGYRIGTLCAMDTASRRLTQPEKAFFTAMADIASRLLEQRLIEAERDRALKLASETEERLRFALDAAGIGDWDMDLRTNVARRSLMHDRCFGYTDAVAEWGYETFLQHVHVEDRDRVDQTYRTAMETFGEYDVEFRCVWPDASTHWLWSKGRFYADSQGNLYRVAGIQLDITPRVLAEAQRASLESQVRESQKNEAIGTLAAGIAHDFNNILGVILGNAKLAAGDAEFNSSVQLSLDEIDKAGLRGRDLVQQILAFSRKQPTNKQVLHPKRLLAEMSRLLRSLLPARVSLVLDLQDDTPFIDADRVQLDQVLMNLVTNAAYALGSKAGEIRIVARGCSASCLNTDQSDHSEYPCVLISVIDNGAGMDSETQRHLFEPFFTTKPVGEGTGLGLAVVQGIVTRHGGKIVVDSTTGVGTRFDLYFPVAQTGLRSTPAIATTTTAPSREPKSRVLYIDDDEALVFLVTRLLERRGHEVTAFVSSREALELLRHDDQHFDIVISDYNMPGANGIDVLRDVVSLRPGVPIALISGYITDAMREDAAKIGVTEIIFKPNSAEELVEAMHRSLKVA